MPREAPETNSTTAIHLVHQTEWAQMLQDNKVSAPWKTVPFGITRAWVFLQEGVLDWYTPSSHFFHWQTSAYLNIRTQTVITMLIHTASCAAKHQSQFTANGNW